LQLRQVGFGWIVALLGGSNETQKISVSASLHTLHRCPDPHLQADFRVGSITDLPYPDASFDVAITNIMYHHLDLAEKRRAVAEITRVLRPGGRYVSAEFGPRADNALRRCLAKGEYTLYPSHLAEAGLRITHQELGIFAWGKKVFYRVAVKPARPIAREADALPASGGGPWSGPP
jgi:SAM-dependent methyltransferase